MTVTQRSDVVLNKLQVMAEQITDAVVRLSRNGEQLDALIVRDVQIVPSRVITITADSPAHEILAPFSYAVMRGDVMLLTGCIDEPGARLVPNKPLQFTIHVTF